MKSQRKKRPLVDRFFEKVNKTSSCWEWVGATNNLGYGRIGINNETHYAHRVILRIMGIEIPKGYDVDHLCRNPRCVNPDHLEVVTHRENVIRGTAGIHMLEKSKASIYCKNGHLRAPENTRLKHGRKWKSCRICERLSQQQRRVRNAA